MSNILQTLSNDIAAVVATASPSIVRVEARRRLAATGVALGDGLIATAHHVVGKEQGITIGLEGGATATATLVGRDPTTDLAILKTDASLPPFAIAGNVGQVGNLVLALGRPGNSVRAALGIISALGDAWQTGMGGQIDRYIQNDVVMYPGFSGGPLVNAAGEMIGLNTSALMRGVSITIPASTVARIAQTLVQHGHVRRGYLGITTQGVQLPQALAQQISQETALLIVGVEAGSPADQSGLVLGDTIVAVANQPVRSHDDLVAQLTGERIGEKTPLSIVRGGQLQSATVTIGERP